MATLLENLVSELNRTIFFREFSFAQNAFLSKAGESKEFADHVVWIDDLMIIYQLKERDVTSAVSSDGGERKWFERKVQKKATKQIRDTLTFLDNLDHVRIENQRGHSFNLDRGTVKRILKIVIYKSGQRLPDECRKVRFHVSSTAGFMHILPWEDYQVVCRTLLTPAELEGYFEFRERAIQRVADSAGLPSESGLLGQFLSGLLEDTPSEQFGEYLQKLRHDPSEFEPGPLLRNLGDKIEKIIGPGGEAAGETGYYSTLAEFAKLNRNELKEVKARTDFCVKELIKGESTLPTRMVSANTGCGFVFVVVSKDDAKFKENLLMNFTCASKYALKLKRHIGVLFCKEGSDILIIWCWVESEWQHNSDLEDMLARAYPFQELRQERVKKYNFQE